MPSCFVLCQFYYESFHACPYSFLCCHVFPALKEQNEDISKFYSISDLCLALPCLGAGHDHSKILGKLRNTRLDCSCQKLRVLDSKSCSYER